MVSTITLAGRRTFPRASADWWQDSGGFTQVSSNGRYEQTPREYADLTRRHAQEIGRMAWASPQDWMCEPAVIETTGLTVQEHQRRTTENLLELRSIAPDLPWVPVLQGWAPNDYVRHADEYGRAGVSLSKEPLVGIGSVCRRQHTDTAEGVIRQLTRRGIRLHGFGFKVEGLKRVGGVLASADSMAWSFDARRLSGPVCGKVGHKKCNNCLPYALSWRERVVRLIGGPASEQLAMELVA
jgi:hypothetical protein